MEPSVAYEITSDEIIIKQPHQDDHCYTRESLLARIEVIRKQLKIHKDALNYLDAYNKL